MTDPFRDALNASEAERGPFRTGEPTPERRLERAREESFARVQELTAETGDVGNVPTDEYVERIPFRETRGYVKRVMGTWQTYRWYMDDGQPFADLSKFNHQAMP